MYRAIQYKIEKNWTKFFFRFCNKEGSQTNIETGTDESRLKDLKIQETV